MAMTGVEFAGVNYTLPNGRPLLRGRSTSSWILHDHHCAGRSGSGKTTLLRAWSTGFVQPTSGAVVVAGKSTVDYDLIELRRGIG